MTGSDFWLCPECRLTRERDDLILDETGTPVCPVCGDDDDVGAIVSDGTDRSRSGPRPEERGPTSPTVAAPDGATGIRAPRQGERFPDWAGSSDGDSWGTLEAVWNVLRDPEPVTTEEVHERVDLGYRRTVEALGQLHRRRFVDRKTVGDGVVIWWRSEALTSLSE